VPKRLRIKSIGSGWLALLLVLGLAGAVLVSMGAFNRTLSSAVPVTLTADRSGLVMEPYAKVKMRGVQVGRVASVASVNDAASLQLDISPDQIAYIPANVEARISASSLFGAKFVDLVPPTDPSPKHLAAGAVLTSQNVAVEVNTVFENVVDLIKQIQPYKLNAVLSALAEGVGGRGEQIGQSITDTNEVLTALNPRTDTVRADLQSLAAVSATFSGAAPKLIDTIAAATTTSATVTAKASQLDSLLVGVAGLSRSGIDVVGPNKDNLVQAINLLAPTTSLLMKYNPELTCLLVGADRSGTELSQMAAGHNGKSLVMDAALMLGDDPYRYPDNLPEIGARGGPGGKPGCGSLPDVAQNWPVRYLVTNTGWGTGLDVRPNPGIGFPGFVDYLPVTRGVPEPPSVRYPGPPAPGPIPYSGAPPPQPPSAPAPMPEAGQLPAGPADSGPPAP
jgi:phospholipid/cholesterol/gamma-HCH transport system substrate-binding protein